MNIIEACTGPFAEWLKGADWAPWLAFHKAMGALPMNETELALFQQCTGRTIAPAQPVTEAWCGVGRRGMKSSTAAVLAVHMAVHRDWSAYIAPGETARVLVVACTKDQAGLIRSYADALLHSRPGLARMVAGSDNDSITLKSGITIQCAANSFRSIRGPAVVCAIFDEVAFWRSDESANPDKEVLRAVRPSMATVPGAVLLGISSVYSKRGLLFEKYRDHHGRDDSKVLFWLADTRTMNPRVDQTIIDEALADDPPAAMAEYMSVWRDDIQAFLDAELLSKLTRPHPLELPPRDAINYFAWADPSGGRGDSYAVGIAHREKDGRCILDVCRSTRPPFDPATVTATYAALVKQYRIRQVTGDNYSAAWCAESWKANSIEYRVSPLRTSDVFIEALPLFTRGQVELPDDRRLLIELASLERRTSIGGKDSVGHPRGKGFHDDSAAVACGAVHLAEKSERQAMPDISGALADMLRDGAKTSIFSFGSGTGSRDRSPNPWQPWLK